MFSCIDIRCALGFSLASKVVFNGRNKTITFNIFELSLNYEYKLSKGLNSKLPE